MEWCEANRVDYIFGLPGSKPLAKKVDEAAEAVRPSRAVLKKPVVRAIQKHATGPNPGAERRASPASRPPRSGSTPLRRHQPRIRRGGMGLRHPTARAVRPRNLIKLHKTSSLPIEPAAVPAIGNQVRLVLAHGAYWLMLTVRDTIPKPRDLADAEFTTLRLRLIKIAARTIETATRVRIAFAAAFPEADCFKSLPGSLLSPRRRNDGKKERLRPSSSL